MSEQEKEDLYDRCYAWIDANAIGGQVYIDDSTCRYFVYREPEMMDEGENESGVAVKIFLPDEFQGLDL